MEAWHSFDAGDFCVMFVNRLVADLLGPLSVAWIGLRLRESPTLRIKDQTDKIVYVSMLYNAE